MTTGCVRGRRSRDAEIRADVADLLDAVSVVREQGPVEAYSHMYRVALWLNANTNPRLRVDRTTSYRQYLHVLRDWASHFGRTRPQVEQAIFELTRQ